MASPPITEITETTCRRCGYVAGSKGNLKIHFKRIFPCHPLLEDIAIEELLQQVNESTHRPSRERKFPCRFCNKPFTSSQSRYQHQRYHCKSAKQPTTKDEMTVVKERLQLLEEALQEKENTAKNYQQEISEKDKKVKELALALQIAKQNIKEETYQQLLEQHRFPGATHLKVACGVTDITTDAVHAEIKRFEDWKEAIGQLMAYNVASPRSELHVYLFGNYSTSCKRTMVSTLKELNIKSFEMILTEDVFTIIDLVTQEEQHFDVSSTP